MTVPSLQRLGSGCLAAVLSLSLNALLLVPLVSGPSRGYAAHVTRTSGNLRTPEPSEAWIIPDDPSASRADVQSSLSAISQASLARTEIGSKEALTAIGGAPVEVQGLEGSGVVDSANTEQCPPDATPPYILHIGGVPARIQRLWSVPVAKSSADFHCRALIQRGPAGEVEGLTLEPCDEDPALQASVLRAIRLATPLPRRSGPPAEMLTLDFAVFGAKGEGRSSSVQPGAADSHL